ncbi:MAG: TolC family protein [Nitrospirae bacterium]|nr:TolC family protein [Nitrospirota bacterium]
MIALVLALVTLLPMTALAESIHDSSALKAQSTRTAPLSIGEVLARIELTHPLLRAAGAERTKARAKILKALGAWEPQVKNYTQTERYNTWNLTTAFDIPSQHTTGYADSTVQVGHPWGFTVEGGLRSGFGDKGNARIAYPPDVLGTYQQQHFYYGGSFHLLRGFMVNEENAQFQQAELAGPQAEIKVAQKRQDLYLAGAVQYWDWQVAVRQAEMVKRALAVAEERVVQVEGLAKGGKVSPLDVVEVNQEVQKRREAAIAAQRKVEYEQYKLSLFIKLAKNKLLPLLDLEGGPTKGAADWVVGLGYRVGVHLEVPVFQREGRGKVMAAEVNQQQLALKQLYAEQQVSIDVDNWLSAQVRARDRVTAATEALRLAKTLEEGERTRFNMGATTVLFVNLRERNVVESAYQLYRAQADYAVSRGGMLWARGALAKPWAESELSKYGSPLTAAGMNGYKQPGRD